MMERYTKKVKNSYCAYLPKDPNFLDLIGADKKNLEDTYDCELSCLVDKLGELEDLMKKYNINSIDNLKDILEAWYIIKDALELTENELGEEEIEMKVFFTNAKVEVCDTRKEFKKLKKALE